MSSRTARVLGTTPGLLALAAYLVLIAAPEPGTEIDDASVGPAQELVISYDGR